MKQPLLKSRQQGITIMEVIIVLFVLGGLFFMALPRYSRTRPTNTRINCLSNLKQIGLASLMWANDHGDKFPWEVSIAATGTLEFAESPDVFQHFVAMSNELISPKVLLCQRDGKRTKVTRFDLLNNDHLSYFVGLDADLSHPQALLSGDRDIMGGETNGNGIMRLQANSQVNWGLNFHDGGNLGFADGSATQSSSNDLPNLVRAAALQQTDRGVIRLALPLGSQSPR